MVRSSDIQIPQSLLAIIIFITGLIVFAPLGGTFGLPGPFFWPAVMIAFCVGVLLLAVPRLFLAMVLVYYGFLYNGVLIGQYPLPIPFRQVLDDLFLAVPIAFLVMKGTRQELPTRMTFFPLAFLILAIVSAKVNNAPTINAVRVILGLSKFYIYWLFVRALSPWSKREKLWAFYMFVTFAVIQFFLNLVWHRGIIMRLADLGRGSIGDAHIVGYISTFATFMLAGWFLAADTRKRLRHWFFGGTIFAVLVYNTVFLTDTKHLLFLIPFAILPFFLFPILKIRTRVLVIALAALIFIPSYIYLSFTRERVGLDMRDYWHTMKFSGKGYMFNVLTKRMGHEVPIALLGAGPGNFTSSVALYAFRPLSVKHMLPFVIQRMKSRGHAAEASVVGTPQTSLYALWGELGIVTTVLYYWFWIYVITLMWRANTKKTSFGFYESQRLALLSSLILLIPISWLVDVLTVGILILPIWIMIAMYWDTVEEDLVDLKRVKVLPAETDKPPPRPRRLIPA